MHVGEVPMLLLSFDTFYGLVVDWSGNQVHAEA